MPGQGRTFRRQIADFWQIWPMPPKIETSRDVVFVDGIYLAKKACILICYDGGPGLRKALKKVWRTAKLQRCIVHAVW